MVLTCNVLGVALPAVVLGAELVGVGAQVGVLVAPGPVAAELPGGTGEMVKISSGVWPDQAGAVGDQQEAESLEPLAAEPKQSMRQHWCEQPLRMFNALFSIILGCSILSCQAQAGMQ